MYCRWLFRMFTSAGLPIGFPMAAAFISLIKSGSVHKKKKEMVNKAHPVPVDKEH
jgi:hypothetical protein